MFLRSAGRAYCRKTPEEEFTRYLHSYGVMSALRSAIVWLYQLPIKPNDVNQYFAEFLENRARDATEISKLRAEMCYKSSELAELKKRNIALDEELKEVEQRRKSEEAESEPQDKDEKDFQIMQRFFQDLQDFHPNLLARGSIITKEDEQLFGGEIEGRLNKLKANTEKKDPHKEFVDDMKKFDPWGLVFPYICKEGKKGTKEADAEGEIPEMDDSLAKQRAREEELGATLNTDDDDARSIAELLHSIYSEPTDNENDPDPIFPTPHQEEPVTWDVEYWRQFFKDGGILPDIGISILDPKSSMFGKVLDANTDIKVEYFNPSRFSSDDATGSLSDIKQMMEQRAKNMQLSLEPREIHDTPGTRNYRLQNVWTSPKFAYGPLPFKSMRPSRPSSTSRKSKSRSSVHHPLEDKSEMDDVIKTDVSYGDPSLRCAKPLRAYSTASRFSQKSSTAPSRRYSQSASRPCSRGRDGAAEEHAGAVSQVLPIPVQSNPKSPSIARKLPSNVVINRPKPSSHKNLQAESISSNCKKPKSKSPSQRPLSGKEKGAGGDCCQSLGRMVSVPLKPGQSAKDASSRKSAPLATATCPEGIKFPQENMPDSSAGDETKASRVKKPRESAYHFEKGPRYRSMSTDDTNSLTLDCEYKMIQQSLKEMHQKSSMASKSPVRSPRKVFPPGAESRKHVTLMSDDREDNIQDQYDPCDPKEVKFIHPYPELLAERKLPVEDLRRGVKRFHQLCRQHYGCEYIQKIQRQFDTSLFDDM